MNLINSSEYNYIILYAVFYPNLTKIYIYIFSLKTYFKLILQQSEDLFHRIFIHFENLQLQEASRVSAVAVLLP